MMDYRHKIFDGNSKISPMFVGLLVVGIIFSAAFPPIGIFMIVAAILAQRRFTKQARAMNRRVAVDARARAQREWIKNFQRDF